MSFGFFWAGQIHSISFYYLKRGNRKNLGKFTPKKVVIQKILYNSWTLTISTIFLEIMSQAKSIATTREAICEIAQSLATEIDYDQLISEGILEKRGNRYKILDMDRLPQHAREKIIKFSTDGTVKFTKVTKSAKKLVRNLSE